MFNSEPGILLVAMRGWVGSGGGGVVVGLSEEVLGKGGGGRVKGWGGDRRR